MTSRLGHKKSRKGCQRCKARKVKCDEVRPICSDCQRHQRACIYLAESALNHRLPPTPAETVTSKSDSPFSGPTSPYSHEPLEVIDTDRRRILELLLHHHFTNVVAATFPGNFVPAIARSWALDIAHVAFEHTFLLNSILAPSALHCALIPPNWSGPNHDFDFSRVHRIYLNLAVQEQRVALSNITSENAYALSSTSLMMNFMSIRLLPDENESYSPPVRWLAMSSAIKTVAIATGPFLLGKGAREVTEFIKATSGPDFRDPTSLLDPAYGEPFRAILNFDDGVEVVNEEERMVYDQTLSYVSRVYKATLQPELPHWICRRVMGLGPSIPRSFIGLVTEQRPRALAILAHHLAMAKGSEQYWWLQGIAEREVYGIQSMLPEKWQWTMQWPLAILAEYS